MGGGITAISRVMTVKIKPLNLRSLSFPELEGFRGRIIGREPPASGLKHQCRRDENCQILRKKGIMLLSVPKIRQEYY